MIELFYRLRLWIFENIYPRVLVKDQTKEDTPVDADLRDIEERLQMEEAAKDEDLTWRACARPSCNNTFEKKPPNKKFCSAECRHAMRSLNR